MNSRKSIKNNRNRQFENSVVSAMKKHLDVQDQNQQAKTQPDKFQNKFQFTNPFNSHPNKTDQVQTNDNKNEIFAFKTVNQNENTQQETKQCENKLNEVQQNEFKSFQIPNKIKEPFQFNFSESTNPPFAGNLMKSTTEKLARPFMFSVYKNQITGQPPTLKIYNDKTLSSLSFMQELQIEHLFLEYCPKITYDLKSEMITELYMNHCPQIQNMEWIQYVHNLKTLQLYDICVQTLNGLEMCKNITSLGLKKCQINDISALKYMNLNFIGIDDNQYISINVLAEIQYLTQINILDISKCDTLDISILKSLQRIHKLWLQANNLCDILLLSQLTTITELNIAHNQISNISALKNLKQLTTLYANSNALKDISVVAYLPNLSTLDISENFGVNIEPLSGKTIMIYLFLKSINLRDIYALRNMINLKELDLSDNCLIDISILQKLRRLQRLDVSFNKIEDFNVFQSGTHAAKQALCYILYEQSIPNMMDLQILHRIQQINKQNSCCSKLNKRYACLKNEFKFKIQLVQNQLQKVIKAQQGFMYDVANLMNVIRDEIYQ
ncbi:LPXTG_cell wall anchor domain-containing protein [Hexamita inflata]|uniref:LPXTG_cell wall anchor domain-containing protein n=1 Tax=Hexamita inflata TaxID=28002 RepID=A0ABP1HP55_9EUKA